jgi:DNA-directed RNA polymerase alpha subunit
MQMYIGPKFRKHRNEYFTFSQTPDEADSLSNRPLSDTALPLKIVNCLDAYGVNTVGDLASKNPEFILNMKNSGIVTLRLCREVLSDLEMDHNFKNFCEKTFNFKRNATKRGSKQLQRRMSKKSRSNQGICYPFDDIFSFIELPD